MSSCHRKSPYVERIYPTSDSIPQNILRMYVQFSTPMKTIDNFENIKLYDAEAQEVKGAIFKNVNELWNDDQTQLTLIFDPARVKTGLKAHDSLGRALRSGEFYELQVTNLTDIHHQKIDGPVKKKFYVTTADTISPDMTKWTLISPKVNTRTPLVLIFSEIVDQMSLHQRLLVIKEKEETVPGSIAITSEEKEWHYIPKENWLPGNYAVHINASLEDPSGNNLNGLFEHPINSLKYKNEDEILTITFEVNE